MKTRDRPMESHTAVISSFLDFAKVPQDKKALIEKELKRYMEIRINRGEWCHPFITKFHTDWYREFYSLVDGMDPYKELKDNSNIQAKELLENLKTTDIKEAVLLSIIGNRIDFGACMDSIYDLAQMEHDIKNLQNETLFIDDTAELVQRIKKAKTVFYLYDNNGEMIFDTLVLEFINKFVDRNKVFLVAKETPMLNDVTVADLKEHGMEKYGQILSMGTNCFGLHEEDVSKEFKEQFRKADLIIAKGQAYMEFFAEYNFDNVINVLRVKQKIVGDNIPTLTPGMNVVMSSKRYAGHGVDFVWE